MFYPRDRKIIFLNKKSHLGVRLAQPPGGVGLGVVALLQGVSQEVVLVFLQKIIPIGENRACNFYLSYQVPEFSQQQRPLLGLVLPQAGLLVKLGLQGGPVGDSKTKN